MATVIDNYVKFFLHQKQEIIKDYNKIKDVVDSADLTDKQKLLLVTDLYAKYEKEIEGRFSDDLREELSRANRVKIHSIQDINMPQMIIQGTQEKVVVNKGSLLSGLTEKEYISHSIENRSLQSIKNSGVNYNGVRPLNCT